MCFFKKILILKPNSAFKNATSCAFAFLSNTDISPKFSQIVFSLQKSLGAKQTHTLYRCCDMVCAFGLRVYDGVSARVSRWRNVQGHGDQLEKISYDDTACLRLNKWDFICAARHNARSTKPPPKHSGWCGGFCVRLAYLCVSICDLLYWLSWVCVYALITVRRCVNSNRPKKKWGYPKSIASIIPVVNKTALSAFKAHKEWMSYDAFASPQHKARRHDMHTQSAPLWYIGVTHPQTLFSVHHTFCTNAMTWRFFRAVYQFWSLRFLPKAFLCSLTFKVYLPVWWLMDVACIHTHSHTYIHTRESNGKTSGKRGRLVAEKTKVHGDFTYTPPHQSVEFELY